MNQHISGEAWPVPWKTPCPSKGSPLREPLPVRDIYRKWRALFMSQAISLFPLRTSSTFLIVTVVLGYVVATREPAKLKHQNNKLIQTMGRARNSGKYVEALKRDENV